MKKNKKNLIQTYIYKENYQITIIIKKLDYKLKFIINYIIVCKRNIFNIKINHIYDFLIYKRKWWILDIKHLKNIFNITKFSYL